MSRWLRWAWRWSWVVTVPGCALFLLWAMATWQRWRKFSVDYDASPWRASLHETGVAVFESMWWQARIRLQGSDLSAVPAAQQLRSVQLFAGESELARLDENLPYSGLEFVPALLMQADGLHKVQMRYRGDFLHHWGYDKKSLRVKTKTDELFAGMRQFNLIAPKFAEQINNALSYRLASLLGLITPHCEVVNVFVNGHNRGVHEFTEQLDEGTLRRHDRMPGDVYSGELVGRDAFRGASNRVFDMPQAWQKVATNNHYAPESRAPLQRLLRLLNGSPGEATQAELSELLDMDAWGRFGAFELLCQTHHFDEHHNWRLFWDPWRSRFEPVIWDPIGWALMWLPMDGVTGASDIVTTRLHQWLMQNGDFLQARHDALQRFFERGQMEQFLADFEVMFENTSKALLHDPNIRPRHDVVQTCMQGLRLYVEKILPGLRTLHLEDAGAVRWAPVDASTVRLQVEGRSPISEVALQFERPLTEPVSVVLRLRHFGAPHDVDLGAGVAAQDATLRVPARLFCQLVPVLLSRPHPGMGHNVRTAAPATYDLCLQGLPADNRLRSVQVVRAQQPQDAVAVAELPPLDVEFLYRATPPRRASPRVWRGDVVIDGIREVAEDVSIEPGTVVRLGPGACILFRGRVTAAGTHEHPIRFVPQHADQQPWGTVALQGPGCSGSRLQWCNVRGGSGHKTPLVEYCSMFSIHDCEQVQVADCAFAENHEYDDMIHVVYASVVFDRVTVTGALSDGVDCDISTIAIRDSSFMRCKNDGVDLMTSRATIHDCRFEHDGDKGISIGEGSHLLALRNRFVSCNIAMEAKDGSVAHVANSDVRRCTKAMNAYKKNWRYDAGGLLTVYKSVVVDNEALATADRWSRLELIDCRVTGQLATSHDQLHADGTTTREPNVARIVDGDAGTPVRHRTALPFPEELRPFEPLFADLWSSLRAETRGVPDGH